MKTCTKCHETKPFEAFSADRDKRRKTAGYKSQCKACANERAKLSQQKNKEQRYAYQAAWRDANRAQWNGWMAAAYKKRQCAQLQRVPAWYDQDKVREIYELAAEFRAAGFKVDVDHIVPLQAAEASGLHWHGNLRVCLAGVNRSKRNEMPRYHGPLATPEQKFV